MNPFLRFLYERGLRPSQLARRSGVPLSTIYAISAGQRKIPPAARRRLARVLKCRPDEIPEPAAR